MCVCLYVCVFVYVHIYVYVYMQFVYMWIYIYICIYIYIYIYICTYIWWYCFVSTNLTGSWPPISLGTPDTRRNIWYLQENAKPDTNRRSNPWAYTPTKTHMHTTINKSSLLYKPIQIFISQIHDQVHQNMHLPIQQKHDTQPLWSHINWGWILSSHKRLILCSHTLQNF